VARSAAVLTAFAHIIHEGFAVAEGGNGRSRRNWSSTETGERC
jgi:hypothetical protein